MTAHYQRSRRLASTIVLAALVSSGCYSANLLILGAPDPRRVVTGAEVSAIAAALGEALPKVGLVSMPANDLEYLRRDSQESDDSSFILVAAFQPAWGVVHSDEEALVAAEHTLGLHRILVRVSVDKRSGVPYVTIEDRNEFRRSPPYEAVERAVMDALAKFPDLQVKVAPDT